MQPEPRVVHTADGYALHYRTWSPPTGARASVVLLTGIMSHSGWAFPLVPGLMAAGLQLVGADRRGAGPNRAARGDAPTAASVVSDALAIIAAEVPDDTPLFVAGWCWGTVLGLNLVAPLAARLAGFVMIAPGLFPSTAIKTAAHDHEARAMPGPDDVPSILSPIDDAMFTDGPLLESFIRTDPDRLTHFSPRYRAIMGKLAMGAMLGLRKLACPLLVLLADDDPATDNDAVLAAVAKLPPERVRVEHTASGHGMQFDVPEWVVHHIDTFSRGATLTPKG